MSPQQLLDRFSGTDALVVELLVLRQHPDTREIMPIGRLVNRGSSYEFCYTHAAREADDLRPLLGFEQLDRRYVSSRLPTIFAQRVMHRERPDYEGYVRSLGLDPATATPWEQIVESGGRREGDTLQFMEMPSVRNGVATAKFFVNGVRHIPDGEQRVILGRPVIVPPESHDRAMSELVPGARVSAVPQDQNRTDEHAMIVVSVGDVPLGWVPQSLSSSVREIAAGQPLPLTVVRVGSPTGPDHQRLVVELNAAVDPGFRFDREGRWRPIAEVG